MKPFQAQAAVLVFILFTAPPAPAQELGEENPLFDVATDMTVVVRDLSQLSTGKPTQERQATIVRKLDDLIARLEKECEACRNASGASTANPRRPLPDSRVVGGPGGMGDLHAARKTGKQWGELPPHQRDRILQSLTEGFPAHYQQILERYYRRLAEEKPSREGGDGSDTEAEAGPSPAGSDREMRKQQREADAGAPRRAPASPKAAATPANAAGRSTDTDRAAAKE